MSQPGCPSKFDTAGEFVGATLVVVPAWQPRGLPLRRRQFASGIKAFQDRRLKSLQQQSRPSALKRS